MIRFLFRKILWVVTVFTGTALIAFLLIHAIPGNPWSNYSSSPRMLIGLRYDEPLLRELNRRFGLDLPLWRQFTRYLIGDINPDGSIICGVMCGNFGPSIQMRGRSVLEILFRPPKGETFWQSQFGYSIRLVLCGSIFAIGLGVPLGILSASRPKSTISRMITVGLAVSSSVPNFVLGLLAIILLASWLRIIKVLPNWENPGHWIIPALVLGLMPMCSLARVTRAGVMNVMGEEYVRAARAKGLSERRVILVHVMRNALVPIVTFLGPAIMEMCAGLLVVESMFSFPGFGRGYWISILELDYPAILGLTILYSAGIVLLNTLVEVVCAVLDPRLRMVRERGEP